MKNKITRFDATDYLDSEEMIAEYLNAVIEDDDLSLLIAAIGDVAKAKGIKQIAELSGLGRESLYKALVPGAKPRFETIFKILKSLGVSMNFKAPNAA
ncbi:MAG: putative addiction module antidote protein [Chlorobi bacterium]|nr:putative addiction module antidote protein [Chlorobiota bacterium]